jgi:hypothetical protein
MIIPLEFLRDRDRMKSIPGMQSHEKSSLQPKKWKKSIHWCIKVMNEFGIWTYLASHYFTPDIIHPMLTSEKSDYSLVWFWFLLSDSNRRDPSSKTLKTISYDILQNLIAYYFVSHPGFFCLGKSFVKISLLHFFVSIHKLVEVSALLVTWIFIRILRHALAWNW